VEIDQEIAERKEKAQRLSMLSIMVQKDATGKTKPIDVDGIYQALGQ